MNKRIPLKNSETLTLEDRSYEIKKLIGSGASCLVYDAEYFSETDGSHLVRIKELYPYSCEGERRDDGTLIFADSERYSVYENRFLGAAEMQRTLSRDISGNYFTDIRGVFRANGTYYQVLGYNDGATFTCTNVGSVDKYIGALIQAAKGIGACHELGYLHLDIKPDNLYYIRPYKNGYGRVVILDFDSFIRKDRILDSPISYSQEYAAPELRMADLKNISERADIYSLGCMLFEEMMGRLPKSSDRSICCKWNMNNIRSGEMFSDRFKELLSDIFRKTLSSHCFNRYGSVDELISALEELQKAAVINEPKLISNLCTEMKDSFIGREDELCELDEKLKAKKRVYLQGVGGIGKTWLASKYASLHAGEYDNIIFSRFNGSNDKLLCSESDIIIEDLERKADENNSDFADRKYEALKKICSQSRVLMILDNFDNEDTSHLEQWYFLECSLIITTRMKLSDSADNTIEVHGLRESRKLFGIYFKNPLSDTEEKKVKEIFRRIEYHTMMVELLAKLLRDGAVDIDTVYKKITDAEISELDANKVRTEKDDYYHQATIDKYMDILFDMTVFTSEERNYLFRIALFGDKVFNHEFFDRLYDINNSDVLNRLIRKGWLRMERTYGLVDVHPLIFDRIGSRLSLSNSELDHLIGELACRLETFLLTLMEIPKKMLDICRKALELLPETNDNSAYLRYLIFAVNVDMFDYALLCEAYDYYYDADNINMANKLSVLLYLCSLINETMSDEAENELIKSFDEYDNIAEQYSDDPLFCLCAGYVCWFFFGDFDFWGIMDEDMQKFFRKKGEQFFLYAHASEKTENKAGYILYKEYSESADYQLEYHLTAPVKAEKFKKYWLVYEKTDPYEPFVTFYGVVYEGSEFSKKCEQLSKFRKDDEEYYSFASELAEYYINNNDSFSELGIIYLFEPLETSKQYELLIKVFEKTIRLYGDKYKYDLAMLYIKLDDKPKAAQLMEEYFASDKCLYMLKPLFCLIYLTDEKEKKSEYIRLCHEEFNKDSCEVELMCIDMDVIDIIIDVLNELLDTNDNAKIAHDLVCFFLESCSMPDCKAGTEDYVYSFIEDLYSKAMKHFNSEKMEFRYYCFCLNNSWHYKKQKKLMGEKFVRAAELAKNFFGEDDKRYHLFLEEAADCYESFSENTEERQNILRQINYEKLYDDPDAVDYMKCARSYRETGRDDKAPEMEKKALALAEKMKSGEPAEYRYTLEYIIEYYADHAPEKAALYIFDPEEFISENYTPYDYVDFMTKVTDRFINHFENTNDNIYLKCAKENLQKTACFAEKIIEKDDVGYEDKFYVLKMMACRYKKFHELTQDNEYVAEEKKLLKLAVEYAEDDESDLIDHLERLAEIDEENAEKYLARARKIQQQKELDKFIF